MPGPHFGTRKGKVAAIRGVTLSDMNSGSNVAHVLPHPPPSPVVLASLQHNAPMQNPYNFVKVEKGSPVIAVDFKETILGTSGASTRLQMHLVLQKRIPKEAPHIRQVPSMRTIRVG